MKGLIISLALLFIIGLLFYKFYTEETLFDYFLIIASNEIANLSKKITFYDLLFFFWFIFIFIFYLISKIKFVNNVDIKLRLP